MLRLNAEVIPISFFFQAEDGIRDFHVTGVQTCALPISASPARPCSACSRPASRSGACSSATCWPRSRCSPCSCPPCRCTRSEERRVGKECRYPCLPCQEKKQRMQETNEIRIEQNLTSYV